MQSLYKAKNVGVVSFFLRPLEVSDLKKIFIITYRSWFLLYGASNLSKKVGIMFLAECM